MKKTDELKEIKKDLRKQKASQVWGKAKHMFNVLPDSKANKLIKQNKAPDISTITEHIAFVIDDEVVEIMHCQPKLAAILLSEPQIIKINDGVFPRPGWQYKDGEFKEPTPSMPEITTPRDEEAIKHGLVTFKEFQEQMKQASMMTFKDFIAKLRKNDSK